MRSIRGVLARQPIIALDTPIFIYHLQAHAKYLRLTDEVFSWMQSPHAQAVTSTITMTELLVQPYRTDNQVLVDQIYGLLSTFPNLTWVAPSLEVADSAARIRARYGLKTPDALQAGTAIHVSARCLITNDPIFRRISGIDTLVLDEFA